jgi:hypothetical protein
MKSLRIGAVLALSVVALIALVSGSALAAKPSHPGVIFGTLASPATSTNAVVAVPNSGPNVTVQLAKNTKFVANSATAKNAGLRPTDAVAVTVRWHKNTPVAKVLRYDDVPAFAFEKSVFSGTCANWDGSTLVLNQGKKGSVQFATNTATKFYDAGKLVNPTVIPNKEHLNVRAQHFTDGTWQATRVDILSNKGKH